ncbi:MAG: hypothetical protein A2Y25_12060 [Candidatus Melainabacteria bacterium GWF2_37_15]|nr:MAG: hypothetical protein A2Y25_12060 [Candidatus Melainabacteria bacterium GWF2_37_15]
MKNFFIAFFIILKTCLCLFFTFFAGYFSSIIAVSLIVRPEKFDWQVFLYLIVSVSLITGIWAILFTKTKIYIKIIYLILFTLYFQLHFYRPDFLPSVIKQFDFVDCAEMGGVWDYTEDKCIIKD